MTEEKQIEISLNEIDVAAVSVGQKAVITFDAIDGLEATGVVTEVDLIGSVSQGVVDYTVKVAIESTDERIKSGMTATVEIITAQKDAVLVVPQSAVTTVNGQTFVTKRVEETAEETVRIPVEVGLKNDTEVEIVSGVSEGDSIVTQTVTRSTTESNQRTQGTTFFGATSAPRSTNTGGTFRQGGMMR